MKFLLALALALSPLASTASASDDKVLKESLVSQGAKRSYYIYVPSNVSVLKSVPLLVVLHGSGGSGSVMVEKWKELAEREGLIVAGPNAYDSSRWQTPKDGPDFLANLVETLKSKYPVDGRRVYLFGHSAGSGFAINISLLETEYFAATAVHASATCREQYFVVATRKIPFAIFVGTDDPVFPLKEVRTTRSKLVKRGFPVHLVEIPGHDHNYSARAAEINRSAWEFFKQHALESDPVYTRHQFKN